MSTKMDMLIVMKEYVRQCDSMALLLRCIIGWDAKYILQY